MDSYLVKYIKELEESTTFPLALILENNFVSLKQQNEIYIKSENFQTNIKEYDINGKKYNISFSKIDNQFIEILFNECNLDNIFNEQILLTPLTIKFQSENGTEIKNIFKEEIIFYIERNLKKEYELIEEKNKENSYIIQLKKYKINKEIENLYLSFQENYTLKYIEMQKLEELTINPEILTPNFLEIFDTYITDNKFTIFFNKLRCELIDSIYKFIDSNLIYYWIIGSDGIGKSITLALLSILIYKKYNFIYFNTKMFSNNEINFKNSFYNELYKLHFLNISEKVRKKKEIEFEILLSKFEEIYFEKDCPKNQKFWKFLDILIDNFYFPLVIIIDQYKNNVFDPDYKYLNKFIMNIKGKKISLKKNALKVIFSSSINNTDTKFSFINNLKKIIGINENNIFINDFTNKLYVKNNSINNNFQININYEDKYEVEFDENDEINQENKEICLHFQKLLTKEETNFKELFKKLNTQNQINLPSSKFLLDSQYSAFTKKEYFSNLISGEKYLKNYNLSKEEEYMLLEFNYSIKYIDKYIKFKKDFKTKNQSIQKEDELTEKAIKSFYDEKVNHIMEKINKYYINIFFEKEKYEENSSLIIPYNKLCELRSKIFLKKKFTIQEIVYNLEEFPMKYLNIVTNFSENEDNYEFNNDLFCAKFKIEYKSNVIRVAINQLLFQIENLISYTSITKLTGAAEGWYLESRVDNIFRNNYFKLKDKEFEVKNLFCLVGTTDNSEKTIFSHRLESQNLNNMLIGKNNYNIFIDDIDNLKNNSKYNLNKKCYYFRQISLTGRTFDMAFIERIDDNNLYNLYLFQCTLLKDQELKVKTIYTIEGLRVSNHLTSIYNIKINEIYLTFILPQYGLNKIFTSKLLENNLNYITFNYDNNNLYDINGNIVTKLNIPESLLNYKVPNESYEKIKNHNNFINLWIDSSKIFLRKKRNQSFHKIYINKIFKINEKKKELILPEIIKEKILNYLGLEETKIIFFGNCSLKNVIHFSNSYNCIIFFKVKNILYFYYNQFYQIETNFEINQVSLDNQKNLLENLNQKDNQSADLEKILIKLKEKNKYLKLISNIKKSNKIDEKQLKDAKMKFINEVKKNIIKINLDQLKEIENSLECFIFLIINPKFISQIFQKIID